MRPIPTERRVLYTSSVSSDGHTSALQPFVCIANPGLQNPQTGPVRFCKHVLLLSQAPTGHRNTHAVDVNAVVALESASCFRRVAVCAVARAQNSWSPPPGRRIHRIVPFTPAPSFQPDLANEPSGNKQISPETLQATSRRYSKASSISSVAQGLKLNLQ